MISAGFVDSINCLLVSFESSCFNAGGSLITVLSTATLLDVLISALLLVFFKFLDSFFRYIFSNQVKVDLLFGSILMTLSEQLFDLIFMTVHYERFLLVSFALFLDSDAFTVSKVRLPLCDIVEHFFEGKSPQIIVGLLDMAELVSHFIVDRLSRVRIAQIVRVQIQEHHILQLRLVRRYVISVVDFL